MGKRLGDAVDPLLVSVRSGAPFSMPGMMDTVLNLGLNDESVGGLAKQTEQRALRVRLVPPLRADVRQDRARRRRRAVRGGAARPASRSEGVSDRHRAHRPTTSQGLVDDVQGDRARRGGRRVPDDPHGAAAATRSRRCSSRGTASAPAIYRRMEKIPDDLGTAVNVQTMVFGNKGDDSGTGVAFTRNPSTGENRPYGDFLTNAQGEDVVAGIRITEPLDAMGNEFPESPRAAARRDAAAREPLPRHVRHRVHDRAGPPVHAADARRQAHRGGRAAHGRRDGGRRPDRQARGGAARAARAARPAPAPAVRPEGDVHGARQGPERVAGRGGRQGVLHRRRRRGAPRRRRARDPRAARDVARRPARHDRGRGHPHVARRARVATRRSSRAAWARPRSAAPKRAADRPRGASSSRSTASTVHEGDVISINGTTGEVVVGEVPVVTPEPTGPFGTILGWADEFRTAEGAHQRRPARGRAAWRASSAPRASASAAPSTCSSATGCRSCSA